MPPINVYSGWLVFYLVVNSCSWTWSSFFSADHPAIQADSGTSPWQEDRAWHVMSFTHGNGTKHGKTRQNMGAYTWKPGCCIWYPPKGTGRPDPNHQSFGGSMSITVRWMVEKQLKEKLSLVFPSQTRHLRLPWLPEDMRESLLPAWNVKWTTGRAHRRRKLHRFVRLVRPMESDAVQRCSTNNFEEWRMKQVVLRHALCICKSRISWSSVFVWLHKGFTR